ATSVRTAKIDPISLDYKWQDMGYPFPGPGFTAGSNSWVVSPKFAGGKTSFLANDPHLPIFYPSTFQEIALDSTPAGGTFRVRGMSIPGLPGVFIGANDKVAWGITNLLADVDDVYIETMSTDGKRVKFLGREVPIEKRRIFRKVRQSDGSLDTQKIVVRWIPHHGPVISDHLPGVLLPPGVILSYRWTGHEGSTGVAGLLDLNRATDFDNFKKALQQWESGPHNFIYADLKGNIGYYAFGRYPKRPDPLRVVAPYLPASGMGTYEWEGYQRTVPELYNPPSGKIVTANNDPYGRNATEQLGGFEEYFGYRFAPGARAKRISDLLNQNKGRINTEVLKKIQFDHKDLIAVRVINMFRKIAQQRHTASAELNKNQILQTLLRWDAVADRNRKEPVYFYTWLSTLMEMYYSRLGVKEWLSNFMISHAAVTSMYHGMQKAQKTHPELVQELFEKSLEAATNKLNRWPDGVPNWGTAHRLIVTPPLSKLLEDPVTVPIPRDGSWFSVDVSGYGAGFEADQLGLPTFYGPNFRMVVSLDKGRGIQIQGVSPLGNGGALDAFSGVQELSLWQNGELREFVNFIE
ncbi:MAG: penicillin acylase family protein, partial [Bdellovibrionales bacterium]|nr:penicillin acylase family protein [Bdellovibrionales bacterium]